MALKDTQEYKELHPNPCYVPVEGQRETTEACFSHSGIIHEPDCGYEVSLPVCCHWEVYFCENGIGPQIVESDGTDHILRLFLLPVGPSEDGELFLPMGWE